MTSLRRWLPWLADTGVAWVAMHMQGAPTTMQKEPTYGDVVHEVADFLFDRATRAKEAGVEQVWIDPGIGFGKTQAHNLSLLRHLDVLTASEFPVVIGASRKTFLGTIAGSSDCGRPRWPIGSRARWPLPPGQLRPMFR